MHQHVNLSATVACGVAERLLATTANNASYSGPTTITLDGVARTDRLWLFGIGASICGSFGVAFGGVLQKRAHTRNDAKPEYERSAKICGGAVSTLHNPLRGLRLPGLL